MQRGAPKGNKNGTNKYVFKQALTQALARRYGGRTEALINLSNKLIDAAENGEQWAIQEIANRFDGKPAQTQVITGEEDGEPIKTQAQIIFIPAKMDE